MEQMREIVQLLGVDTIEEVTARLAAALGESAIVATTDTKHLLLALAHREKVLDPDDKALTPTVILNAIAKIDARVAVMNNLGKELRYAANVVISHSNLVRRLYEDGRFVGQEARGEIADWILPILQRCDTSLQQEDLELFFEHNVPTTFFYETVRARAEELTEAPELEIDDETEDAEEEEEEEDSADTNQAVRAYVRPFSVNMLFDLIEAGRLDVNPEWQRTDVWSLKKKRELIKSLLLGIPLPSVILHQRGGFMSIIDGKQRLLSIVKFMRNEFTLPKFDVAETHPLRPCSGAFYKKAGKRSLPANVETEFRLREIPALLFEEVPESRLRSIFHLYNVSGTKLNAAEIRNAVYQANPIHRVLYVLAGEGTGGTDLGVGGIAVQEGFCGRLSDAYPGAKLRYQGMDFLARYLGYSRAAQSDPSKRFAHPSTSTAINNYFDHASRADDPTAVAREILEVFDAAERYFDRDDDSRLAFFTRGPSGKRKFSKLAATSHMVAARFLLALTKGGWISQAEAEAATSAQDIAVPEKQQSATIWDYQAQVLLDLRDSLAVDVEAKLGPDWGLFFEKMEFCRLPVAISS